jgi:hypothetical protein
MPEYCTQILGIRISLPITGRIETRSVSLQNVVLEHLSSEAREATVSFTYLVLT